MDAIAHSQPAESKLHFLDYWRVIRIRKTVIIAVLLLVVITVTVVTFLLPPTFMSTVRIAVEKDVPDVGPLGASQASAGYDPYFILTEFERIQSKSVLHVVIDRLKLNDLWAKRFNGGTPLTTPEAFQILKSKLGVRQSRNTSLIEISVYGEDANEASHIANTVAEVYKETRLQQRSATSAGGIAKLQERLQQQEVLVKDAQKKVDDLRRELGVTDPSADVIGGMTLEPETLRRFLVMKIEAEAAYDEINTLFTELQKKSRPELKKAITTAVPDGQLVSLLDQLGQTEQKLTTQLKDLGVQNPDVERTSALLAKITIQVDDRLDGIMAGLATRVASAKARFDKLEKEVTKYKELDIEAAQKNRRYFDTKTDLVKIQQIRDTLNLKVIQETIDTSLPKSSIVVVTDIAEPGLFPVRPNKKLNIGLGIAVGLVLGIGLAFFIEYLDTSVKTLDDVEKSLQSPVLGVIPQNVGSLLEEGQESPHAEAYRVLRSNMLFSKKDGKFNTICVVSAGAGEGKSTTIFNLACTFAQSGQRVIIVDSDLRRPSLQKHFKVSNSIGLTNYLQRQNTLEEVIQTTSLPTLDFLPSGKLPSSSVGILNSVQMKALIHELKRRYDFVFFDSPPILGVSDASILASEVDMTLLVVQYRKYPQAMTMRAKQMVEKVGGNLIGVVLNNINMAHDSYYYYYSGFYSNYYAPLEEPKRLASAAPAPAADSDDKAKDKTKDKDQPKLESKY
ncbi:MAG: polysaccharide biosynthesis tyrosine autokinase [Verrucomicrobia bacterium]|nr:polysaccharide biosynthesis tyrosine autokinase [Verrucomicrobiota bacterium]